MRGFLPCHGANPWESRQTNDFAHEFFTSQEHLLYSVSAAERSPAPCGVVKKNTGLPCLGNPAIFVFLEETRGFPPSARAGFGFIGSKTLRIYRGEYRKLNYLQHILLPCAETRC
jgi:hypothetical protein